MSILQRYLIKVVIFSTLLMTLVILGVLVLINLLAEAKSYGVGDYGILPSLYYVALHLPSDLYRFSPLLILLGAVLGLSTLVSSRELAIMRVSGLSIWAIIKSVMLAGLILVVLLGLVGEGLGPRLNYLAEVHKENAKNAGQAVMGASGIWLHIDNNFIHVQRVMGKQVLKGVTRFEFNEDNQLIAAYYANTLTKVNDVWELQDVVKTRFYDERTKSQSYPSMPFSLALNDTLFNIGFDNPNDMSLFKLNELSNYLTQNGLQNREYTFSFWRRVIQPFASLVMILLAIPFVLGADRQSHLGLRIMFGLLLGFIFYILNAILGQLSMVYQVPTLFAAMIPPLLFLLVAYLLVSRLIKQ